MAPERVSVDASPSTKTWEEDRHRDAEDHRIPAPGLPCPADVPDCDLAAFAAAERPNEIVLKRAEDLIVGFVLLIVFAPVMAVIALAIRLDSAGPAIYRQRRHGQFGRPFWVYKFRSMFVDADDTRHRVAARHWIKSDKPMDGSRRDHELEDDDRVTCVGAWIRKSYLDELPQLWNVLLGHMSVVGPRPPVPYEYEEYGQYQRERLVSKPGITGLWQVSGHHRLSFEDMVNLDIRYTKEWSIWMDIWIMVKTIPLLLLRRGV